MQQLLDILATFLTRHWIIGFANAGMTACLGYAVLGVARRARLLSEDGLVRWRRWVTLAALFKGAFYLVLGLSVALVPDQLVAAGLQLPDVRETLGFQTQTRHSIWRPTELPEWVKLGLVGTALAMLLFRAAQMLLACRQIDVIARLESGDGGRPVDLLHAAARTLGLTPHFRLPRLVLIPAGSRADALPTPFLLGLRRPRLVLSSGLAALLTDEELEAVFRHELAHLVRRDHWWRWLQLYAEDVGRVTLLAGRLSRAAVEMEENLCDRLAVRSPRDARQLGAALQKASAYAFAGGNRGGPTATLPSLLGNYASSWRRSAPLTRRLEALVAWSREQAARSGSPSPAPRGHWKPPIPGRLALRALQWAGRLLVAALLLLVLYPKFILTVNLQSLHSPRTVASRGHRPAGH